MFGGDLNTEFSLFSEGISLTSSDVVTIKVTHPRPYLGNFNATILVKEEI
jgi:hypothetical protein